MQTPIEVRYVNKTPLPYCIVSIINELIENYSYNKQLTIDINDIYSLLQKRYKVFDLIPFLEAIKSEYQKAGWIVSIINKDDSYKIVFSSVY